MTTPYLPSRTPGASGRQHTVPEPLPGAPSRSLRIRASGGWQRFQRRVGGQIGRAEDGTS
ncbi:hypothetical protein M8Z33_07455 [Streptomyces sp. ZAF1911]|uniref:hypothetical protein n=1 Tax=Streptomyces sp. ZAF1911 TaxID=2944129 RepID=UPI00237B6B8D|nr:hypothetical protein [Streptomyces sp. ZAF1911]MDD9376510.1 hypothetical protein [Streptomyces sp. ZAF1911]